MPRLVRPSLATGLVQRRRADSGHASARGAHSREAARTRRARRFSRHQWPRSRNHDPRNHGNDNERDRRNRVDVRRRAATVHGRDVHGTRTDVRSGIHSLRDRFPDRIRGHRRRRGHAWRGVAVAHLDAAAEAPADFDATDRRQRDTTRGRRSRERCFRVLNRPLRAQHGIPDAGVSRLRSAWSSCGRAVANAHDHAIGYLHRRDGSAKEDDWLRSCPGGRHRPGYVGPRPRMRNT